MNALITGAATLGTLTLVAVAIAWTMLWLSHRERTQRGPDGHYARIALHEDDCPCERCAAQLRRDIQRLELDLELEDETLRNPTANNTNTTIIANTLTAERIYPPRCEASQACQGKGSPHDQDH